MGGPGYLTLNFYSRTTAMQCSFQCQVDSRPANAEYLVRCAAEMSANNAQESVVRIFAEIAKPDFKITHTVFWIHFVNGLLFQLQEYQELLGPDLVRAFVSFLD